MRENETFNIGDKVYHYDAEDEVMLSGTIIFIVDEKSCIVKRDDDGKNHYYHNCILSHNPIDELEPMVECYEGYIEECEKNHEYYENKLETIKNLIEQERAKNHEQ